MAYALVVLVYLAVNFLFAALMNSIAIKKGYENSHAFALVFFFGVLGMLYVIALPDMKVTLILSFIALSVLGMGTSETALGVLLCLPNRRHPLRFFLCFRWRHVPRRIPTHCF